MCDTAFYAIRENTRKNFFVFIYILMLSTLDRIFSKGHSEIVFLFFPENKIEHLMQIVSNGDNLH